MQDTPTTIRRMKRTFLGIPLIGWVLLVAMGTALAAAVFVVTLGTTGTISVSGDTIDDGAFTFVTASETVSGPCSITIVNPTTVDIQAIDLAPGDQCDITVDVANAGATAAAYQRFDFDQTFPQDGSVPAPMAGWGPRDGNGQPAEGYCGTEIPATGTGTVGIRIDANSGQIVPGEYYDFLAGDGFMFVPAAQYVPDDCG